MKLKTLLTILAFIGIYALVIFKAFGAIELADKVVPKNGSFIGIVDSSQTIVNSGGFNKNLSPSDDTAQKVFNKLDQLSITSTVNLSTMTAGATNYIFNQSSPQSNSVFNVSSGTVSGNLTVGAIYGNGAFLSNLPSGFISNSTSYIQNTGALQSGSTFFVSSGTVSGTLRAGSFVGDGSGLTNISATNIAAGSTNYIQNTNSLQSGASFYVGYGTVNQLNTQDVLISTVGSIANFSTEGKFAPGNTGTFQNEHYDDFLSGSGSAGLYTTYRKLGADVLYSATHYTPTFELGVTGALVTGSNPSPYYKLCAGSDCFNVNSTSASFNHGSSGYVSVDNSSTTVCHGSNCLSMGSSASSFQNGSLSAGVVNVSTLTTSALTISAISAPNILSIKVPQSVLTGGVNSAYIGMDWTGSFFGSPISGSLYRLSAENITNVGIVSTDYISDVSFYSGYERLLRLKPARYAYSSYGSDQIYLGSGQYDNTALNFISNGSTGTITYGFMDGIQGFHIFENLEFDRTKTILSGPTSIIPFSLPTSTSLVVNAASSSMLADIADFRDSFNSNLVRIKADGTLITPLIVSNAITNTGITVITSTTPVSLSTHTHNWDTGQYTVVRASASVNIDLTGFSGGSDGREIKIFNISSSLITFKNNDSRSTAANRILCNGTDQVLASDEELSFYYDGASQRWRCE